MDHTSRTDGSDGSSNAIVIHKQFSANVPGTDFTMQSSDGVVFHLHRKNLELYTDGEFPGVHDSANGFTNEEQMLRLDEPSSILEIVFQFMYPRRQPSLKELKGLGFQTLSALADTVEKYKVFAAMTLCEEALIDFLQDETMPLFQHALRHRRVNLLNQSAMYLSRKPLFSVLDRIPPTLTMPWLRYLEVWKDMFDAQLKQLEGTKQALRCAEPSYISDSPLLGFGLYTRAHVPSNLKPATSCRPCLCSMIAWVNLLQRMDDLSDLKAALTATIDPRKLSHTYVFNIRAANLTGPFSKLSSRFQVGSGFCPRCSKESRCYITEATARGMLKNIAELPPFTSFLNEDLDGEAVVEVGNE